MRKSIATVSLAGMLREKLEAAAAAGFDGVEIFENDLLQFSGRPSEVRAMAADLGLAIDMFQPFRDFDGASAAQVARSLDRAERKFEVMGALGTDLILVCSSVQPDAPEDVDLLAELFHQLAVRAAQRGMRIAYEALAWGSKVRLFSPAWAVVERVAHPSLGLALDSFHTLALRNDPAAIAKLPSDKIFYVQLADAPWVNTDVLTHSRHYRCFPGQGELDLTGFMRALLSSGYDGTVSLEIFNDDFRSAPARPNAVDAMRSLRWLEEQVRLPAPNDASSCSGWRVPLFDAPPAPTLQGWSFIEFAVDPATSNHLVSYLSRLGFRRLGSHRSKRVDLYALGDVRIVLNLEPDSLARSYFDLHGPSACAVAFDVTDAGAALKRAEALGCTAVQGHVGKDELAIPAVRAPDGSLVYFCDPAHGGRHGIESDFIVEAAVNGAGAKVDHITQAVPPGQVDSWVLFQRAVLGLLPVRTVVLHDPYGVIRSRELESADKAVRCSLGVSERDNTVVSRSVSRFGGAGVQQIAIAVDDLLATVSDLRRQGAPCCAHPTTTTTIC